MNDQTQAKALIASGSDAIAKEEWSELKKVNYSLLDLLPRGAKEAINTKIGFGL